MVEHWHALFVIGAALLGLCIGSFLTVVTWRVPLRRSIVQPGSACPECGHVLRWYENVPAISWCVQRGRCRACNTGIPVRYAVLEVGTALAFALVAVVLSPATFLVGATAAAGLIALGEAKHIHGSL